MKDKIPAVVEPFVLARRRDIISGQVPLTQLPRLQQSLGSLVGSIWAKFEFDIDKDGRVIINCLFNAELTLNCQRCLANFDSVLDRAVCYSPILEESLAKDLPELYEPVLLDDRGFLVPKALVEDELILSLPIIPTHESMEC